MIGDKKTPRSVLEAAYKKAVISIIADIFHVASAHATEEVAVWWNNMAGTRAMKSGMFLHDAPLRTAAEVHGAPEPELSEHDQTLYQLILRSSLAEAKAEAEAPRIWDAAQLRHPAQTEKLSAQQEPAQLKPLTATAGR